ncbi:MAG: hypothetical protein ACPGJV_06090, partial [Bacteriovoracaceae bacterium]
SGIDTEICYSPIDCARLVLSSIVDLYKVSKFQAAFFPTQIQNSPGAFNPYAERVACEVYDPWYKTQASLVAFFSDLANAAISFFSKGLLYSRIDLKPGRVTSFKTLVEEGKIEYEPIKDKKKLDVALSLDLGPLFGAPCAIAISGPRINQNSLYQFNGISVGLCHTAQKRNITVYSATEIETDKPTKRKFCFDCRLNFESVASLASGFAGPVGGIMYVVRAFVRLFKGLKDPHDVPRDWKVNLNHLMETYNKFGKIPKKCVEKLSKGKRCLLSSCEEKLISTLDPFNLGLVTNIEKISSRTYEIKYSGCKEKIKIKTSHIESRTIGGARGLSGKSCRPMKPKIPKDCQ